MKQIIKKRIKLYNELNSNSQGFFDEDILTDKIYNKLITNANGNISFMLDTLEEIADLLKWQDWHIENIESE